MTAGASAGYVFANALIYWITKLQLGGLAGSVLYIGYSALISFLFFILTGKLSRCTPQIRHLTGSRHHRILRQLGVRAENLWLNQDRLRSCVGGVEVR